MPVEADRDYGIGISLGRQNNLEMMKMCLATLKIAHEYCLMARMGAELDTFVGAGLQFAVDLTVPFFSKRTFLLLNGCDLNSKRDNLNTE